MNRQTAYYRGWTITVSLFTIDTYRYIASNGNDMYIGTVQAWNSNQAIQYVIEIIDRAEG